LAAGIALLYLMLSLVAGGMLRYTGSPLVGTARVLSTTPGPLGAGSFGLALAFEGWTLNLPIVTLAAMALVALGVGVGMGAGVLLSLRWIILRRSGSKMREWGGALGVLTPAMVALLTLGACCSTAAAAVAGIGVSGGAAGTSGDPSLLGAWALTLVQLGVLSVSLLAQERLLQIFPEVVVGSFSPPRGRTTARSLAEPARARPAVTLGRVALPAAAILWAAAVIVELLPTPSSPWLNGSPFEPLASSSSVLALWGLSVIPAVAVAWASSTVLRGRVPFYRLTLLLCALGLACGVPLTIPAALPDRWGTEGGFGPDPRTEDGSPWTGSEVLRPLALPFPRMLSILRRRASWGPSGPGRSHHRGPAVRTTRRTRWSSHSDRLPPALRVEASRPFPSIHLRGFSVLGPSPAARAVGTRVPVARGWPLLLLGGA
jgi:hypothetical protein